MPLKEREEYSILLHPYVTEKTMNAMSGTSRQNFRDGNSLEFLVKRSATKSEIREAFEKRFQVKVEKINVKIRADGKHAIIKLKEGYSAEELGVRLGVI
ncbi:MAG: 50S ribosomal protein L23 [Methanomassiliicoccales archaeon]